MRVTCTDLPAPLAEGAAKSRLAKRASKAVDLSIALAAATATASCQPRSLPASIHSATRVILTAFRSASSDYAFTLT